MKRHFSELTYTELEAIRNSQRTPVLLFPVGATEPHGPHAPLATDMLISIGMCERACDRLQDDPDLHPLILPPLPFGVTRCASAFPGGLHVSEATLGAVLADVCAALIEQGLRYVVLVNNHLEPEHVATLHATLDEVERRHGVGIGYLDLTRRARAARLTEEFRKGECHAGRYETSLVLADRPDTVDADVMAGLPDVPVSLPDAMAAGHREFVAMGLLRAYNGAPSQATAQEGERSFAILTEMLVESMRDLVAGTGGRDAPGAFGRETQ